MSSRSSRVKRADPGSIWVLSVMGEDEMSVDCSSSSEGWQVSRSLSRSLTLALALALALAQDWTRAAVGRRSRPIGLSLPKVSPSPRYKIRLFSDNNTTTLLFSLSRALSLPLCLLFTCSSTRCPHCPTATQAHTCIQIGCDGNPGRLLWRTIFDVEVVHHSALATGTWS
ncbi:uncharacterized protein IWZ02DRAFT_220185 [Phyllosticta citriasiana]|uniref:uncharacterized protein n=1 Tax=Phyllosticta citriasiana TaxID=595635 RepID=UPI0030FDDF67